MLDLDWELDLDLDLDFALLWERSDLYSGFVRMEIWSVGSSDTCRRREILSKEDSAHAAKFLEEYRNWLGPCIGKTGIICSGGFCNRTTVRRVNG